MNIEEGIVTSKIHNVPARIFRFKAISFLAGAGGFAFGLFGNAIFKIAGFHLDQYSAGISLLFAYGAFAISEYGHGGRYPYENFEKMKSKYLATIRNFNLKSQKEANPKNLKIQSSKDEVDLDDNYDSNSIYLPTGEEIIGIRVIGEFENDKLETVIFSEAKFQSFLSKIMGTLPIGASVKLVAPNFIDLNVPGYLKDKQVMTGDYFIYIRLPFTGGEIQSRKRDILKNCVGVFKRMTSEEIFKATEKIFHPFQEPTSTDTYQFRTGFYVNKQGGIEGNLPGIETAIFSLVQLPKFVDDDFQKIYQCISDLPSCVALTAMSVKPESSLMHLVKEGVKKNFSKKKEEHTEDKLQEDETSLLVQISILVHGTREEIKNKISDIDAICIGLGQERRAIFGQDIAFASDALKSFLPGKNPSIPFRTNKVLSIKEISFYAPVPKFTHRLPTCDLALRTLDNRFFQIKHSPTYPAAFVSPPESGKSLFLSLVILAQVRRKKQGGVGGCYIEIGGSFMFLCEQGLADAWMIINKDDKSFLPLDDHPFHAFFAFDELGIESATEWICEICDINYDEESSVANEIRDLVLICYKNNLVSLKDFFKLFDEKFSARSQADLIWKNRIQNLKNFVDPNVYGNVFVPQNPKDFNWKKAKFIYFASFPTNVDNPKRLYSAFFSMAITLSEMLCEKHNSKKQEPLEIQFILDELHAARDNIPQKKLRNANSQSRKDGKIPMFSTQETTDLIIGDEDEEKKYGVIATTRRFFFKEHPGELIKKMLKASATPERLSKISKIAISNIDLKSEGKHAWGYIDENKQIHQLIVDVDPVDLWACSTHAGSIAIRQACLRTGVYDYWTTCDLLAKRGPFPLPKTIPPKEEIEKIVVEVIRNPKKGIETKNKENIT